jgi:hypothetical protein
MTTGQELTTRLRALAPLLADVVVPIVAYLGLKRLGLGDFWALTLSGVGTGAVTAINSVRRRRLDFIGVLIIIELALTVALLFSTKDPRFVAVRPAFYTVVTGLYLGLTCFVGRPITYLAAQPMVTRGEPDRTLAYERAWERSAEFRRRQRLMTAAFALVLLIEAALRVIVVFHYPARQVQHSFLISQLPGIILLAAVLGYFRLQVPALSRIVRALYNEITGSRAASKDVTQARR